MQQQQQDHGSQHEYDENGHYPESVSPNHSRTQSDPTDMDADSYSDPIDLITARENGKHRPAEYFHSKQSSGASRDSFIYNDENYSNPIDILKASAQSPKSVSSNDSNYNAPTRPTKLDIRSQTRSVEFTEKSITCNTNEFQSILPLQKLPERWHGQHCSHDRSEFPDSNTIGRHTAGRSDWYSASSS